MVRTFLPRRSFYGTNPGKWARLSLLVLCGIFKKQTQKCAKESNNLKLVNVGIAGAARFERKEL